MIQSGRYYKMLTLVNEGLAIIIKLLSVFTKTHFSFKAIQIFNSSNFLN